MSVSLFRSFKVCRLLPRLQPFLSWKLKTMATSTPSYQPIVISGPSGSGKSTLLGLLFKEFPDCFAFSVSHTTRKPRSGEEDGKDYHFVEKEVFAEMIENGDFLEHAQFSANCYGTSKQSVKSIQSTGRICFLDVEINGVKSIKKTDLAARYVFVQPPNMEVLKERLVGRGTESDDSLKRRLDSAQEALDYANEDGAYDHIIVNDDLDEAYSRLKLVVADDIKKMKEGK
ncbi:guanylate kinase-like [Argopecten irradians]|uniref:guanylate kinase-like n=1 Tax=Argopecten irradians TaxID=31199 RepID=UPI00371C94EA